MDWPQLPVPGVLEKKKNFSPLQQPKHDYSSVHLLAIRYTDLTTSTLTRLSTA